MIITDIDLYMKFQRQPRALGTPCFYAPRNKLLIPDGIRRGDHVFICDYTQSKDDVYVTVANMRYWKISLMGFPNNPSIHEESFREYMDKIASKDKVMVIWKDLAQ